jgi:signal transduction histidine kinase
VIAYLGVPLRTPDGSVIGSLCAVDGAARKWTADHVTTLTVLADAVMNEIAVRLHVVQIEEHAGELLRSHEALERYASELKSANATKDKFFSIIAHDLRGPLHALQGYSESLLDETGATPGGLSHDLAVRLRSASGNLVRLVENLLQWARMQRGELTCSREMLEVSEIIRSALAGVQPQADRKGVMLESDVAAGAEIFADPHMTASIFHNLLTNAIKFTPEGGHVRVVASERQDVVEVYIEDDGVGMDAETVASLFGRDEVPSRRGTDGEKGTGLGLTLCREFVGLHGGRIWAQSSPGIGTRIFFALPTGDAAKRKLVA